MTNNDKEQLERVAGAIDLPWGDFRKSDGRIDWALYRQAQAQAAIDAINRHRRG